MLELIFKGFVEWGYELLLECWEYFSGILMDILNMDFSYLRTHVPVVDTIMQIMLAAGWALLLGNLVFQSVKGMTSGLGFESEDPRLLFTRTFVFAFLLLASPQICQTGLSLTQDLITVLQIPDAIQITFADESIFGGITASWLLIVIIGIVIMFKVFRLILEIAERYVILGILTICAPLAFGVGGSRSTSDIFTGWCRMFASMCFVMVSNVIFLKMLLSVLSYVPSGLDVLPWMVLVLTITKVARKIDSIITRIGLNPAITGDSPGGRGLPGMLMHSVLRAATKQVVQAAEKYAGGGARGAAFRSPFGGRSGDGLKFGVLPGGGPFGKGAKQAGHTAGTAGVSYQNTSSQQSSSAHSGGQGGSAVFHAAAQNTVAQQEKPYSPHQAAQAAVGAAQPGANRPGAAGQNRTSPPYGDSKTRQSFVPPGTRRPVSHVKQPPSGTAGMGGHSAGVRPGRAGPVSGSGTPRDQFTQSVQQSNRDGGLSMAQHNGQQQNISVAAASSNRQGGAPAIEARWLARSSMPTQQTPKNGMAGTGAAHSQPQTPSSHASASRPNASAPSGAAASPLRHGRNSAAPSSFASPSKVDATSRTAKQERVSAMGGAAFKAAGTAGMGSSAPGTRQQRRPAAQPMEQMRFRPPTAATGDRSISPVKTAWQEKTKPRGRQSSRREATGGDENGKS